MGKARTVSSKSGASEAALIGDLTVSNASTSAAVQTNEQLLKLPQELRIEVLSYVVRQGDTINMKEGKITREGRRWIKEVEKLKDPNWKPPKKLDSPGALRTCREMYISGVQTFWGGNTFSFKTLAELQQFLDQSTMLARKSIRSVSIFHGYHAYQRPSFAGGPTLQLLGALPSLETVDLDLSFFRLPVFAFRDEEVESEEQEQEIDFSTEYDAASPADSKGRSNTRMQSLMARDSLLKTIPLPTLAKLTMLTIRKRCGTTTYASNDDPSTCQWDEANCLSYIRDLHARTWHRTPFPSVDGSPRAVAERVWNDKLWREARAAVYWDDEYGPPDLPPVERRLHQWSIWSAEWAYGLGDEEGMRGLMGKAVVPTLKPRSFDQLFEIVEEKTMVREEQSLKTYLNYHPETRLDELTSV